MQPCFLRREVGSRRIVEIIMIVRQLCFAAAVLLLWLMDGAAAHPLLTSLGLCTPREPQCVYRTVPNISMAQLHAFSSRAWQGEGAAPQGVVFVADVSCTLLVLPTAAAAAVAVALAPLTPCCCDCGRRVVPAATPRLPRRARSHGCAHTDRPDASPPASVRVVLRRRLPRIAGG